MPATLTFAACQQGKSNFSYHFAEGYGGDKRYEYWIYNGSVQFSFDEVGIFKVRIRTGFAAGVNDPTQQLVTVLSRGSLN